METYPYKKGIIKLGDSACVLAIIVRNYQSQNCQIFTCCPNESTKNPIQKYIVRL